MGAGIRAAWARASRIDTEDPDVERRGRALLSVLLTFVVSLALVGSFSALAAPPERLRPTFVVIACMSLVLVASGVLARRGRVDLGGLLISGVLSLTIVAYLLHVQTYTPFLWFTSLSVVVASITVRPRLIWVSAAINFAVVASVALVLPVELGEKLRYTTMVSALLLPMSAFTFFSATRTQALFAAQRAAMSELEAAKALIDEALQEANAERHRAEAASRAKSTFLANMSHELRTPLNAMIGYAELIEEEGADDETRRDLQKIQHAGRHLLGIIDDILDVSRVEAGKLTVAPAEVDLEAMVRELQETLAPAAARAGDALVIERAPACARVFTDPLRLKQILLNLLGNAVKFTEEGMITLRVTCADEVTRFEVSDTGIGMDAETLDRVFVEFTQADESSTRRYGGAGLGLALSLRLARLLGARLSAASTPGEGSTFTLELPARPPAA
ncbi:MAG: hypothetical protein H6710_07660 [Myxococcales bacterium]|nr:hypothetical protein [Myxococcales bacterium]